MGIMASTTLAELVLEVALLRRRIEQLTPPRLVGVAEFAVSSGLSSDQIRRKIRKAIDFPADSPLQNGVHYVCLEPGARGAKIKINPELFREAIGLAQL